MTAANRILRSYGESITVGTAEGRGFISCVEKSLRVNNCAVLELFEVGNVDRLEGLCKDVVEASLRDTTCQRHLAAFEADADAAAGTCLLALVATACGLAVAGCVASALALVNVGGASYGRKFMNIHYAFPPYSSVTWRR